MMITSQELDQVREHAKGIKTMVIGDAMLDRYIFGQVDRISPEAPVPVLTHHLTEEKAGGSANVALNLAAWGCPTSLIGLTGNDTNADRLAELLDRHGIHHHLFKSDQRPTTVKTRIVASSHHLLRIDEESTDYLTGPMEEAALAYILNVLAEEAPDLIILEDYNKGLLTEKIISSVLSFGQNNGVFIAVDPKFINFFNYEGVDLFKPNLREAEHAARQSLSGNDLRELCSDWVNSMRINTIAITLGGQGIYLQVENEGTHILPGRPVDVVDVCGAGDAVICSLALGLMSGLSPMSAGILANMTGAYVCSHSGVVTIDVDQLYPLS